MQVISIHFNGSTQNNFYLAIYILFIQLYFHQKRLIYVIRTHSQRIIFIQKITRNFQEIFFDSISVCFIQKLFYTIFSIVVVFYDGNLTYILTMVVQYFLWLLYFNFSMPRKKMKRRIYSFAHLVHNLQYFSTGNLKRDSLSNLIADMFWLNKTKIALQKYSCEKSQIVQS